MRVCLTFGFFRMLRQSNLAHIIHYSFDPTWHTCKGVVVLAPLGLLLLSCWSKTRQTISFTQGLLLLEVPGLPADPVAVYGELLVALPTTSLTSFSSLSQM